MKALLVPSAVLALVLTLSLWTGSYIDRCTCGWLIEIDTISSLIDVDLWDDAQTRLHDVYRSWKHHQSAFHLFLEHQDLVDTEELFSGAIASCLEQDSVELHIHLDQLSTQLVFLAETQAVSIQNIL